MSKRNIAYIKPEEPSFLKKLKLQAGYKEGPTVETKREDLGPVNDEDFEDTAEEQPTVVVLKPGDLTAEEAVNEQQKLDKEEDEKPADLDQPIVFKPRSKSKDAEAKKTSKDDDKKNKKSKKVSSKTLLSFNDDEDEEDEEGDDH